MLYGNKISGRIKVAVVLPEQDPLSRRAMGMLQSLESVKSLCDFTNMSREEAENGLKRAVCMLPFLYRKALCRIL